MCTDTKLMLAINNNGSIEAAAAAAVAGYDQTAVVVECHAWAKMRSFYGSAFPLSLSLFI